MRSSHLIVLACCVAAVSLPAQSEVTVPPPTCTCDAGDVTRLAARVVELESAVAALQAAALTIPSEPVSFVDSVLAEYTGSEWYRNGKTVTAAHLVAHGIEASELEGRSARELGLLHGAIHTTGLDALRRSHSGENIAPVAKGHWKKTCRNGRCVREWIPHNQ